MKKALSIGVLVLAALTAGGASAAPQGHAPVGQQSWAADGWLYQMTANGWARTSMQRRGTAAVYEVYLNGQPLARVDTTRERGWVHEYHHRSKGQVKYPANNPAARYHWVDNTRLTGTRGWLNEQQALAEVDKLRRLTAARGRPNAPMDTTAAAGTLGGGPYNSGASTYIGGGSPNTGASTHIGGGSPNTGASTVIGGPNRGGLNRPMHPGDHSNHSTNQHGIDTWLAPAPRR